MTRVAPWVGHARRPGMTALALIAYAVIIAGGIGLEIRPPNDAPAVEAVLSRAIVALWVAGGLIGIPSAWLGKVRWERVAASAAAGGAIIAVTVAVLLDVLPSWPPLSRPVLTTIGLVILVLFWAGRLIDLKSEPSTDRRLPAEVSIQRADDLRGRSI